MTGPTHLRTAAGEPDHGPWEAVGLANLAGHLTDSRDTSGPFTIAVDGRSGSGKSTLAARLAGVLPRAVVVHTDDVAWYESFFGWDHLLVENVLAPAQSGEPVAYRPTAWDERQRPGAITVPAGTEVLLFEGVGAARQSLSAHLDASIWVASDHDRARIRGIERDGGPDAQPFWDLWQSQELPFLAQDQPWTRATAIVCGTPEVLAIPHDAASEVLLARGPLPGAGP